jgi:hypothetical protein
MLGCIYAKYIPRYDHEAYLSFFVCLWRESIFGGLFIRRQRCQTLTVVLNRHVELVSALMSVAERDHLPHCRGFLL